MLFRLSKHGTGAKGTGGAEALTSDPALRLKFMVWEKMSIDTNNVQTNILQEDSFQ